MKQIFILLTVVVMPSGLAAAASCTGNYVSQDSLYAFVKDNEACPGGYVQHPTLNIVESGDCPSGYAEDTSGLLAIGDEIEFDNAAGTYHFSQMCAY